MVENVKYVPGRANGTKFLAIIFTMILFLLAAGTEQFAFPADGDRKPIYKNGALKQDPVNNAGNVG
jgi:hypothetical protein